MQLVALSEGLKGEFFNFTNPLAHFVPYQHMTCIESATTNNVILRTKIAGNTMVMEVFTISVFTSVNIYAKTMHNIFIEFALIF